MKMINKEQLLYFFLQGKISLSQYDYKFMANLQTMIINSNRITTNQAELFDKLISKYNKQLTKNGHEKETLKKLPWKTLVVESTPEYTGATVSLFDDEIVIRTPFNKSFISAFRNAVDDNPFIWDKDTKRYRAKFSTSALKITASILNKYFPTVRYTEELDTILAELSQYDNTIWNPTIRLVNNRLILGACNEILGELIGNLELETTPLALFNLSQLGINIDSEVYQHDDKLKFAASRIYEIEITESETLIEWMKTLRCDNVIFGRGLRNKLDIDGLSALVSKYGMTPVGPLGISNLPAGVTILLQHTSNTDSRNLFIGNISKVVVLRDSRPIEVK